MKTAFRTLTMMSAMSIVLLLGSCSKDGDPGPDDLIIGNWEIVSSSFAITVNTQSLIDYFISQGVSAAEAEELAGEFEDGYSDANPDGNLEFKKGGTYSSTGSGSTSNGTWELSSDRKTLTLDKGTSGEFVFSVTTLTSSNLNLTMDQVYNESGFEMSIHMDIALTR